VPEQSDWMLPSRKPLPKSAEGGLMYDDQNSVRLVST